MQESHRPNKVEQSSKTRLNLSAHQPTLLKSSMVKVTFIFLDFGGYALILVYCRYFFIIFHKANQRKNLVFKLFVILIKEPK